MKEFKLLIKELQIRYLYLKNAEDTLISGYFLPDNLFLHFSGY